MFCYSNKIVQDDLREMVKMQLFKDFFEGKCILVTGATGMLASYITYLLCYLHKECEVNLKVLALCRTKSKADILYSEFYNDDFFSLLLQDICEPISYDGRINYIFNFAGNASPYFIKNDPVGILKSNLIGTFNILEFARQKHVEKVLFASTREVYGKNEALDFLTEMDFGSFDCLESRACYPESKRAAETLYQSYYLQYGVSFNTVRLAHSYGPGMILNNDGRIMADLMSNVVNRENIILKSNGEAVRSFCYITDAVLAIFLVMIKGKPGRAYNIANESEPISIKDLANFISTLDGLEVIFQIPKTKSDVYCNYRRSGLNCDAIMELGWKPNITLKDGIIRTYKSFVDE